MLEATPANMRSAAEEYGHLVAVDPATGEQFSANAGDYFYMHDDESLTNDSGEPLELAIPYTAGSATVESLATA